MPGFGTAFQANDVLFCRSSLALRNDGRAHRMHAEICPIRDKCVVCSVDYRGLLVLHADLSGGATLPQSVRVAGRPPRERVAPLLVSASHPAMSTGPPRQCIQMRFGASSAKTD